MLRKELLYSPKGVPDITIKLGIKHCYIDSNNNGIPDDTDPYSDQYPVQGYITAALLNAGTATSKPFNSDLGLTSPNLSAWEEDPVENSLVSTWADLNNHKTLDTVLTVNDYFVDNRSTKTEEYINALRFYCLFTDFNRYTSAGKNTYNATYNLFYLTCTITYIKADGTIGVYNYSSNNDPYDGALVYNTDGLMFAQYGSTTGTEYGSTTFQLLSMPDMGIITTSNWRNIIKHIDVSIVGGAAGIRVPEI